ncbi:metal-dependent hydrolase [Carboxylicivirga marina]|uniref:metal-dependent hydrolase n=1 Tax=Carboxylicivirga marina TaxID=2800988 RepID=UPI0025972291|nr:metal-dependent hydrolase [uncultured Carboxylicivirga sp.]
MDILTHTISGLAAGTLVAGFCKAPYSKQLLIIAIGGLAGALPDVDAISLWSGFDATFGKLFDLTHSGREIYSAKFWYSHHGFMHSISAALIISTIAGVIAYLNNTRFKQFRLTAFIKHFKVNRFMHLAFILGFLIHLLEDMPTPASNWGGVNLFWPSETYIGGFGHIWWWNNYDIFLIVCGVFLLNFLLLALRFINNHVKNIVIAGVFCMGLMLSVVQVGSRDFDFAYSGSTNSYHAFEAKSKALQKEILGEDIYNSMVTFDNLLSIYF